MIATSDSELVIAVKSSNFDAFETLFLRYHDLLYKYLWRQIQSEELSKDLMQETFIRLWMHRNKLDADKNIKAYLYKIAHNLIIEYTKKTKREKTSSFLN